MADQDLLDANSAEADKDAQDQGEEHEEEHQEAKEPTEIEALALEMGWAAEADWRGDPDKWVDAKTYIRTGPEILKKSLERQDRQLAETAALLEEFKGFHGKVEERAYKRALGDLKTQQRQAVEDADPEAFERIDGEIDALGEEIRAPAAKPTNGNANPDNDPHFIAFQGRNSWYGEDFELTAYADQLAPAVGRKHTGAAFYETIGTEVRKKFPDKFTNTRRKRARTVESAGAGGDARRGDKHTYADLPAEAKGACDRFITQGMFKGSDGTTLPVDKAREKYVAQYDWSE